MIFIFHELIISHLFKRTIFNSVPTFRGMAGKGYFQCRGEKTHILLYDIPDGESVETFSDKTPCRECESKIDFSQEFNG